mmetsp:Transcript_67470/g.161892  ORF Transcript_67470/g.161892 Transcript_67470/m.161892 type:complete len:764 (+) Transcript_67470:55-2346(+)
MALGVLATDVPPGRTLTPVAKEAAAEDGSLQGSSVSLEEALKLLRGTVDEERFVGASLVLRWVASSKSVSIEVAATIINCLEAELLCRMLATLNPEHCRGIAVGLLRGLIVDRHTAMKMRPCIGPLLGVLVSLSTQESPQADELEEGSSAQERTLEPSDVAEACRQLLRYLSSKAVVDLAPQMTPHFSEMASCCSKAEGPERVEHFLTVVQELLSVCIRVPSPSVDRLLRAITLNKALRNTQQRQLGLGLLSDRLEAGSDGGGDLGAVLGEALAGAPNTSTSAEGTPWQERAAILRLAAAALPRVGLSVLHSDVTQALKRLRRLLTLAAGEVRTSLEGQAPQAALCAACMLLEAAVILMSDEATSGAFEVDFDSGMECLSALHRTLGDVYDYCKALNDEGLSGSSEVDPDTVLPLLVRFITVYQLEDSVKFAHEFSTCMPVFCRLKPAEFQVLIPAVQNLQDWHQSPALIKVLQVAEWAVEEAVPSLAGKVFPATALMTTEVALDAIVYLPEAIPCGPPALPVQGAAGASDTSEKLPLMLVDNWSLPRPAIAADWQHAGVGYLVSWSRYLWSLKDKVATKLPSERFTLATLCGALLVSVPEEAVHAQAGNGFPETLWSTVAEALMSRFKDDVRPPRETEKDIEEASTWRLTLRLCGFALDRHSSLRWALSCTAADRSEALDMDPASWHRVLEVSAGGSHDAPDGEDIVVDEWRKVDEEAVARVTKFLRAMSKYCFILGHKSESTEGTVTSKSIPQECQLGALD